MPKFVLNDKLVHFRISKYFMRVSRLDINQSGHEGVGPQFFLICENNFFDS